MDIGSDVGGWNALAPVGMEGICIEAMKLRAKSAGREPLLVPRRLEDGDAHELRDRVGLRRGDLGLPAGGPPCQAFTTSVLGRGINDARASWLFPVYFESVEEFQPHATLVENVDGTSSADLRHRPLSETGGSVLGTKTQADAMGDIMGRDPFMSFGH